MQRYDHNRCRGCGAKISPDDEIVEVSLGHLIGASEGLPDFERSDTWGYMHQHCFLVAVGDPTAIFSIKPSNAA